MKRNTQTGFLPQTGRNLPTRWRRLSNGTWKLPATGNLGCADPPHQSYAHDISSSGDSSFRVPDGSSVNANSPAHGLLAPYDSYGLMLRDSFVNAVVRTGILVRVSQPFQIAQRTVVGQ